MTITNLSHLRRLYKSASEPSDITEDQILAVIGKERHRYQIGSASCWFPEAKPSMRRLAEWLADLAFPQLGDAVARRIAISAITGLTERNASSPAAIASAAIGHAVEILDADAAQIRERLFRISRTREQLAGIAAHRKERLAVARKIEREVARLRKRISEDEITFRDDKPMLRLVRVGRTRDLPRADRLLAEVRASIPAYHLGAAARRTRDDLNARLRRLRGCRQALKAAARHIAEEHRS